MTSKGVAVILGAGPGLGYSISKAFASEGLNVALLARSLPKLEELASLINSEPNHGKAKGYAVSASDEAGLSKVFASIKKDLGIPTVGVHNPGGGFSMANFRESKVEQLDSAYETHVKGGFLFSQAMVEAIESQPDFDKHSSGPKSALFFTGATASLKAGAKFSTFSPSKFAVRALAQSLAREYAPKGVHVCHVILDGFIDSDNMDKIMGPAKGRDTRLNPDDIAQSFVSVWKQPRSAWTQELDLRPFSETF